MMETPLEEATPGGRKFSSSDKIEGESEEILKGGNALINGFRSNRHYKSPTPLISGEEQQS